MKQTLVTRRQEMVRQRLSIGHPLPQVVKQISGDYGVTESAIRKDWRNRKRWLSDLLHINDPEAVWLDIMARHQAFLDRANTLSLRCDNSAAEVGALRLCRDLNLDLVDIMENYDYEKRLQKLETAS